MSTRGSFIFPARVRRINVRHLLPDLVLLSLSLYVSLFLRVGTDGLAQFLPFLNRFLVPFLLVRVAVFVSLGVYDIIWRYISLADSVRLIRAIALSSAFIMALTFVVDIGRLPRAVFFIDLGLSFCLLAGIRFLRRLAFEGISRRRLSHPGRLTLVYGAGVNGRNLVHRIQSMGDLHFNVVGFIDDDPRKVGRIVGGCKVLGTRQELADILKSYQIAELVVAMASPPGDLLRDVVQNCRPFNVTPRLMSGLAAFSPEGAPKGVVREIELSDLLSRPVRNLNLGAVRSMIQGKRVLVTGAGGSIGSELARQVLSHGPSRLVLLDHSEFNLYRIDSELRPGVNDAGVTVPILADVTDRGQMERVFRQYVPELVFHAAAYKHVHLVESNPHTAILNNVLGTQVVLELSETHGVANFVLISTDKAVNPAGVMGATKRVCEMMVAESGLRTGRNFCAVRFGNVLGSSGSLIPLLKGQIERGEPVTITHREVTRYFMLIPEAVSLVLCAATMSEPADIMILRMGDPVRIVDIAKSLIALMGRSPDQVPIVFTGLRPGEKLYEELYLSGKEQETENADILVLPEGDGLDLGRGQFARTVDALLDAAREGGGSAVFLLRDLVKSTYNPTTPLPPSGREKERSLLN